VLQELRVENLLLIEQAQLRLAPGLNVLTGETGAGKTVLAHALDLLLGGRARPGIVRPGASEAYVEGIFDLPASERLRERLGERLSADAQELVLARRVGSDGRTRAYLNGRSATVGELRDVGAVLLAFYGQHEHRKLTLAASQLEILDGMCAGDHAARLRACAQSYADTRQLEERLASLRELSSQRERELDLLAYELSEIDALAPDEREHERLLGARERLRRLDALRAAAGAGAEALSPESGDGQGATQLAAGAAAEMDALAGVDPALDALAERMRALAIESQDLAGELHHYCERAGADELASSPEGDGSEMSLDALEGRLDAIERLARKHGGSVRAVLDYELRARARHDELAGADVALAQVSEQLSDAHARLRRHVLSVRRARVAASASFSRAVREQLGSLAMGEASFEVILGEREPGPHGADSVEFVIAPNPGVPAGPLREIASGGELSRVMLAIMSVAHASPSGDDAQGAPQGATLVFDEVDAGIGGHTARVVGARLRELGERRQVLCITHLPQIASLGARHFSIVKDTSAEPTRTTVLQLAEGEVVSELVRMLGADSGDVAARRHARDLRRAA
jgi:DNA repair protein RecN (Recombination protein N)